MIALDDNIEDHPKFVSLSNDAFALWVRCIGYCRRNLTDGFIPAAAAHARARCKDPRKPIAELTSPPVGSPQGNPLWVSVSGGFQIHDYMRWNPSKAQVEAQREQKRIAGKSGGQRSGETRRKQNGSADQADPKQNGSEPEAGCFASGSPLAKPDPIRSGSDPKIPTPIAPPLAELDPETPPPASGGGGEKSDMRGTIAATMASIPVLAELGHAAGVEALAATAVMAGRKPEAVADAIRHLGVRATTGAWSRNRIEGGLSRAVQFAKLPETRTGDAAAVGTSDPPQLRTPTPAEVARAQAAIDKRRAWLVALSDGSQATTPAPTSQNGAGAPKAREESAIQTEPDGAEVERATA